MPASQTANAKEKFMKEIKCYSKEHTNDKKANRLIADREKVSVIWTEDRISQNIPLSQSLIQSKALTLQFCEGQEK